MNNIILYSLVGLIVVAALIVSFLLFKVLLFVVSVALVVGLIYWVYITKFKGE